MAETMGVEIERRFLVAGAEWRENAEAPRHFRQAYLAMTAGAAIRVRIDGDAAAWLTIKSANAGRVRAEFEYAVPVADALTLIDMRTGTLIDKQRFIVPVSGMRWEVDVFSGALAPLVIAEIELDDESQAFECPAWLGAEVTDDGRYANASLALHGLPDDFVGDGRG
jgi:adenylate cyclase